MLSEAELQELRGMPFDRMLLRLWPKWNPNKVPRCQSCGGMPLRARGLCSGCYERWHWGQRSGKPVAIDALPPRHDDKRYRDILTAKRVGVTLATMMDWRNGTTVPILSPASPIPGNLEVEFGVPADLWRDAVAVSRSAEKRSWHVAVTAGLADAIGRQYGYWVVVAAGNDPPRGQRGWVQAQCLLCRSMKDRPLWRFRNGTNSRCCKACAPLLRDHWLRPVASGFKGVYRCQGNNIYRGQWKVKTAGRPVERHFPVPAEAARYYDACMYERYGHTLFLNFPDEYDGSNDPVFASANKATS